MRYWNLNHIQYQIWTNASTILTRTQFYSTLKAIPTAAEPGVTKVLRKRWSLLHAINCIDISASLLDLKMIRHFSAYEGRNSRNLVISTCPKVFGWNRHLLPFFRTSHQPVTRSLKLLKLVLISWRFRNSIFPKTLITVVSSCVHYVKR